MSSLLENPHGANGEDTLPSMRIADLMSQTWAYRAWQAPFAQSKIQPLLSQLPEGLRYRDVQFYLLTR